MKKSDNRHLKNLWNKVLDPECFGEALSSLRGNCTRCSERNTKVFTRCHFESIQKENAKARLVGSILKELKDEKENHRLEEYF